MGARVVALRAVLSHYIECWCAWRFAALQCSAATLLSRILCGCIRVAHGTTFGNAARGFVGNFSIFQSI